MRHPGPRLRFLLPLFILSASMLGCSAAQKSGFTAAMTGPQPATDQSGLPGAIAPTSTGTAPAPAPTSIEGITKTAATVAATVAATTAGTPVAPVAAIIAAVASGLLIVERLGVLFVGSLPNSKSSSNPSMPTSASAGGATGPTPQPATPSGLTPPMAQPAQAQQQTMDPQPLKAAA